MRKHAILSASSAARWLKCPPSALINEKLPDFSSSYAEEGTLAHEIGEIGLQLASGKITKRKYTADLKKLKEHSLFYPGMLDEVQEYIDFVVGEWQEALTEDPEADLLIEQRLDYSKYAPEGFGTGDAVIVSRGHLHVIDLKFGTGTRVDVYENPQLKLYALGAYEALHFLYDIDRVKVTVAQVRLDAIETFEISVDNLVRWGEEVVKPAATLAIEGSGELQPGEWCAKTYCKLRDRCKARAEHYQKVYEAHRDRELTNEELGQLLPMLEDMKKWAVETEKGALNELLTGGAIPGWKAVEGRSNRVIPDEGELAKTLMLEGIGSDQIYKPAALKGITALEKILGKKSFEVLVEPYLEKPPGKPTLAPASDKRPALKDVESELTFD